MSQATRGREDAAPRGEKPGAESTDGQREQAQGAGEGVDPAADSEKVLRELSEELSSARSQLRSAVRRIVEIGGAQALHELSDISGTLPDSDVSVVAEPSGSGRGALEAGRHGGEAAGAGAGALRRDGGSGVLAAIPEGTDPGARVRDLEAEVDRLRGALESAEKRIAPGAGVPGTSVSETQSPAGPKQQSEGQGAADALIASLQVRVDLLESALRARDAEAAAHRNADEGALGGRGERGEGGAGTPDGGKDAEIALLRARVAEMEARLRETLASVGGARRGAKPGRGENEAVDSGRVAGLLARVNVLERSVRSAARDPGSVRGEAPQEGSAEARAVDAAIASDAVVLRARVVELEALLGLRGGRGEGGGEEGSGEGVRARARGADGGRERALLARVAELERIVRDVGSASRAPALAARVRELEDALDALQSRPGGGEAGAVYRWEARAVKLKARVAELERAIADREGPKGGRKGEEAGRGAGADVGADGSEGRVEEKRREEKRWVEEAERREEAEKGREEERKGREEADRRREEAERRAQELASEKEGLERRVRELEEEMRRTVEQSGALISALQGRGDMLEARLKQAGWLSASASGSPRVTAREGPSRGGSAKERSATGGEEAGGGASTSVGARLVEAERAIEMEAAGRRVAELEAEVERAREEGRRERERAAVLEAKVERAREEAKESARKAEKRIREARGAAAASEARCALAGGVAGEV